MIALFRRAERGRAPYTLSATPTNRVPSLSWLCLRRLAPFADQIQLPTRLNYDLAHSDILEPDSTNLDPRLWATLIQVYDHLPAHLRYLHLPLADPYLLFLQHIPSSPTFVLLTILDLPGCPHLTDTSITALSSLHALVALDASATSLSPYAIKAIAGTLIWADGGTDRRGPWPLRILRLRYCCNINSTVYLHLSKFPLLSVIDLRGTQCRPPKDSVFKPSSNTILFHPLSLAAAVDYFSESNIYPSQNYFKLMVTTLNHPPDMIPNSNAIPKESYTFLPTSRDKTKAVNSIPSYKRKVSLGDNSHTMGRRNNSDCKFGLGHVRQQDFGGASDNAPDESSDIEDGDNEHLMQGSSVSCGIPPSRVLESTPEMFYFVPLPHLPTSPKYDPLKNYDAGMYYACNGHACQPVDHYDSRLALYRTPPPWSALEVHNTRPLNPTSTQPSSNSRGQRSTLHAASVNREHIAFQIDLGRLNALRKSGTARRLEVTIDPSPTYVHGRNPFRRQSTPALDISRHNAKPLKPLSSVEIPQLPMEFEPGTTMKWPVTSSNVAKTGLSGYSSFTGKANTTPSTWADSKQDDSIKKRSRSQKEGMTLKRIKAVGHTETKNDLMYNVLSDVAGTKRSSFQSMSGSDLTRIAGRE